jgi:hypothetical protein
MKTLYEEGAAVIANELFTRSKSFVNHKKMDLAENE